MKASFWIAAAFAAGSFIYGLITNPSTDFIISWLAGSISSMAALAASIMRNMNKK